MLVPPSSPAFTSSPSLTSNKTPALVLCLGASVYNTRLHGSATLSLRPSYPLHIHLNSQSDPSQPSWPDRSLLQNSSLLTHSSSFVPTSTFATSVTLSRSQRKPTARARSSLHSPSPPSPADQNPSKPKSKPPLPLVPLSTPSASATTPSDSIRRTRKRHRSSNIASNSAQTLSASRAPSSKSDPAFHQRNPNNIYAPNRIRQQVRKMYENAKELQRTGDIHAARSLFRDCLALDRSDAHSWLALALLEARKGGLVLYEKSPSPVNIQTPSEKQETGSKSVQAARAIFKEAITECPKSVHLLQAWAVLELRCGNREAARNLFEKGLALQPDNAYVCQAWGLLEQRVGNTEKARDLFARSVELRPNPEVCAAWAVLEAREGNIHSARQLYRQGLNASKSNSAYSSATIYRSWAEMEERVGDLPEARQMLTKAITSQPRMTEAYVALAMLEARRGGTVRAVELMRAAASLSPKPPASVFNCWAQIEATWCGQNEKARALLEKGHKLHPNDPALLQTLGILEEKAGNIASAKKNFYDSVRIRPTAPAFVAWALLEEKEGNQDKAMHLFEEALSADALHGAAYNAYGMMEARRGCLDKSRSVYERGLKVYASASVWHGYGQLELKLGRNPDRARELFRQGVGQSREDTSFIWHSWGMLELSQRNIVEARRVFDNAKKRYPRNSRVLVGAALSQAASSSITRADDLQARDLFKHAVAADPTHAHAWQAWGVFELRRGRTDAAQALFRRGLRLCPTHGALWQAWGVLETARGNFRRARQLFQKGSERCPVHVHLLQAWACMEVRSGNINKARELLDRALESDPCHGPVWNAYGLLEAQHGTLAKARQNFMTGIRRAPNHAPLYRAFGQAECRVGNYERAKSLFVEGLRVDPRHAPLYHASAQFEAMLGNVSALAELKIQAEKYFGSESVAACALRSGDEGHIPDEVAAAQENMDHRYDAKDTPMELALNGGDTV